MNAKLIIQLVEVVLAMTQTQLDPNDVAGTLVTIAKRTADVYEQNTGQPMDLSLIKPEAPV